jgi:hypothetical protein
LDNLQPAFFVAHRQRIVEAVARARRLATIPPALLQRAGQVIE